MRRFPIAWLAAVAGLCATGVTGVLASSDTAATVNGHSISMAAYNTQVIYMRRMQMRQTGQDVCTPRALASICSQLKKDALNNLINEELVHEYAASHHLLVPEKTVDQQWKLVVQNRFHGMMPVVRAYVKSLDITVNDLKDMVRQDLQQQKVIAKVTASMPRVVPAVRLGRIAVASSADLARVRNDLKQGVNFLIEAQRLTAKKTSICGQNPGGCGDLGWLPNALLPAGQRSAAIAAPGTILSPIYGQSSITLIQVLAHRKNYLLTPEQEVSMRQQLFNTWLAKQAAHATIKRYVST